MDNSCRILDINVGKCRSVLRGHVDSVNSVHFKPYSTILASASADKTLSVWDARTSLRCLAQPAGRLKMRKQRRQVSSLVESWKPLLRILVS